MLPILKDNSVLTMSSREIAELVGTTHDSVLKTVRDYSARGVVSGNETPYQHPQNKQTYSEFHLSKRDALVIASGYSVELRARIIDRWQELENQTEKNKILVPDFSNPAEAARAWATQYEAAQLAIATKAEIGSRREATAMNTASQAVKQVNKLEIELDRSKQFSSVKRMEMLYHGQKFNWRELKTTCSLMGLTPIDIFDANYGTVKAWPAEVWLEVYALEIL